jgi:hypothetical protein
MMAARLVLLVLLTVSLDLAVPFVPVTNGLQWDDDEEMVQMRRPRIVREAAARTPAQRTREPEASRTMRVSRAAARATAFAWLPLLLKPASSAPTAASPPEPH